MMKARLQNLPYGWRLLLATVALGIGTGLVGIACHFLLDGVQRLAFGQERSDLLQQFQEARGLRRFLVLSVTGLLAAGFWYLLQKRYKILSIRKQIDQVGDREPAPLAHILHASMQVAIVGAGASVGKEGAPREVGALLAGRLGKVLSLTIKEQRVLIACGAGAGLAAVYQVPLTSVFFVFETLGIALSVKRFFLVGLATYVSTYIAGFVVSDHALYQISALTWSLDDMWLVPLLVLFLTPLAWLFARLNKQASSKRIKDKRILYTLPVVFLFLVGLASYLPHLLGNGRMMAQEILNGSNAKTVVLLFVLKALVVLLALWAGAYGGTLTPSFAFGIAGGALLTMILGGGDQPAVLLLGSVCFLAVTLKAPLSATGLVMGFTGQSLEAIPFLLVTAYLAFGFAKMLDRIPWEKYLRPKTRIKEN